MRLLSLIMSTRGRVQDVLTFCSQFAENSPQWCELIIVDQNDSEELSDKIISYVNSCERIRYIKGMTRGLSAGRNEGLCFADGAYVGFPDDDCLYSDNIYEVIKMKIESGFDFFVGRCFDPQKSMNLNKVFPDGTQIAGRIVFDAVVSVSLFVRKTCMEKVLGFDESLGAGTRQFPSGEEVDLVLRLIAAGCSGVFSKKIEVFHPHKDSEKNFGTLKRVYLYGKGTSRVLERNKLGAKALTRSFYRPFLGAFVALLAADPFLAVQRIFIFVGRVTGYFESRTSPRKLGHF